MKKFDVSPKIATEARNILEWRKPSDHPCDMENAIWVANGFGGRYSIQEVSDGFLLWLDDDEFVWKQFGTVEKCQRYAECRFQHVVSKLYSRLKNGN